MFSALGGLPVQPVGCAPARTSSAGGRGICVHSVLHSEFNHVGARRLTEYSAGLLSPSRWLRVRTTAAATDSGFQDAGTLWPGRAGADPRLTAS